MYTNKTFRFLVLSLVACGAWNSAYAVSCDSLTSSHNIADRVRADSNMGVMPSGGCTPGQMRISTTAVSGSDIVKRDYCLNCGGGIVCSRPNATSSSLQGAIPGFGCATPKSKSGGTGGGFTLGQ